MQEQWKACEGHSNYEISNMGNVRNVKTGRTLKPWKSGNGYLKVNLENKSIFAVHRLVATAFCPQGHDQSVVDHINRNRQDNRACNLEWVTYAENTRRWQEDEEMKKLIQHYLDVASGDNIPY